jgi:hypothetical protein
MNDTDRLQRARDELRVLRDKLALERDELRLQLHLARAELREEFDAVERKWEHFQTKASAVAESAGEGGREIAAAAGLLGEELGEAYRRIRDAIKG